MITSHKVSKITRQRPLKSEWASTKSNKTQKKNHRSNITDKRQYDLEPSF